MKNLDLIIVLLCLRAADDTIDGKEDAVAALVDICEEVARDEGRRHHLHVDVALEVLEQALVVGDDTIIGMPIDGSPIVGTCVFGAVSCYIHMFSKFSKY